MLKKPNFDTLLVLEIDGRRKAIFKIQKNHNYSMKVKNVTLTIGLPEFGTEIETDHMCCSYLTGPDGINHGGSDTSFCLPEWKIGDRFVLDIPSGTFEGIVGYVRNYGADESAQACAVASVFGGCQPSPTGVRLSVTGEWDGKEGGLLGGLCAFGGFRADLNYAVVVESTLLPKGKEVPYPAYKWAKEARYMLGIDDEEAGKLIAHISDRNPNDAGKNRVLIFSKSDPSTPMETHSAWEALDELSSRARV